jgi:hypothetical protein
MEFDGIVGLGRDAATGGSMAHVDLWLGRTWRRGVRDDALPRALVSLDAWASGYHALGGSGPGSREGPTVPIAREWSAGTARIAVAALAPAARGRWSARLAAEDLADPDPDTRGLTASEPALRSLPGRSRLAEAAVSFSLDRAIALRPVSRGFALEGVIFSRSAMRWEPASAAPVAGVTSTGSTTPAPALVAGLASPSSRAMVSSLGVGLQLTPRRFGRASLRLEVGMPVAHSAAVPARPFVGISIVPAFGAGRARDGAAALATP